MEKIRRIRMKPKNKITSFVGKRIIFFKILGLLTALSLMTVLIFGVFINQLVVKNQKKNIDDLNLHQLQRISSDVELVFDLLAQGMTRSMWSDDFIDLMITPDQHNADLTYRVIKVLQDQVEENDLVRKSYLYLPYSDEVYVYSGTYMELKYLGDRELIHQYLETREEGREPEATSEWRILLYNRRIFLATDFCLPNFVGAMFYEINRAELYDIIQAENEKFDTTIYVYDEDGNLLFDYMAAGPQPEDFSRPELFLTATSGAGLNHSTGGTNGASDGKYYMYTSELLGWKYLVRVNPRESAVPFAALVSLLLPGLAFYILVSQLFSLYITKSVYSPINRLIHIATNPKRRDKERRHPDEVDFLELAFLDSLDKNEQHRELMDNISDDILEQLLRSILSGKSWSSQAIAQTLQGIGRMDLTQGYYLVLAAEISYEEKENLTMVEQELYQRSLLRLLVQKERPEFAMVALPMELNRAALVLCFDREYSVIRIRETAMRLSEEIYEGVAPLPYRLKIGKGKVYGDLLSIQFSYHEAVEDIQYLQYMADASEGENAAAVPYENRYYVERAHHGYALAESGCMAEAMVEFDSILEEIMGRETTWQGYLQNLIDDMLEKLISCRVTQEEMKLAGISNSLEENQQLSENEEPRGFMQTFYQKSLPLIWESSRKSHNRYVEDAKEYIASHYADGKLTLNEISEAVGISPSYLSGIFAEGVGIGLNAYLNDYRIRQAKRFLDETSLNISEIGYKCGFNSAQSFTRVFKKHTGMTPKQFRELPHSG